MVGYVRHAVAAAILVTGLAAVAAPAAGADPGRFVIAADIHFDPFDPPGLVPTLAAADPADWTAAFAALPAAPASQYGKDTNHVLFASALAAIAAAGSDADFAIVAGDLLSHGFVDDAAAALGAGAGTAFAEATSRFVVDALGRAMAGKPVIVALGNNDSDCGDYALTPGGGYLAAVRDAVKALAGAGRVAADFDRTWDAGGYYAMRHPVLDRTLVVVVNDVLWSERYRDACGSDGAAAGKAEMDWLRRTLAAQAAAGGRVWMIHHIPWGIDSYSTTRAKAGSCAARIVPLLQPGFAEAFLGLVRDHAGIIDASLSGHIHTDDYRLLRDADGVPRAADKTVPAISPIFGQNPAFQVFTYDRDAGRPADFATIRLANLPDLGLEPGDWGESYAFSEAYGLPGYSAESVAALSDGLAEDGRIRDAYRTNYNAGHGPLPAADLTGYACAVDRLDPAGFSACWCGG